MGKTVIGTMMKKRRGYGFVSCEEMEKDVFVPKVLMRGVNENGNGDSSGGSGGQTQSQSQTQTETEGGNGGA